MAFNWGDYLEISKFLVNQGNDIQREAALRSAVSRAYYGAFCHARNYAIAKLNYVSKPTKDHQELPDCFYNNNFNDIENILVELRGWRNKCDYDDKVSNLENLASHSIADANHILKDLI